MQQSRLKEILPKEDLKYYQPIPKVLTEMEMASRMNGRSSNMSLVAASSLIEQLIFKTGDFAEALTSFRQYP